MSKQPQFPTHRATAGRVDTGQHCGPDGAVIEVRIPRSIVHIPAVRAVAADLAVRQDFDLDAVSDLRMAVDEACAELVGLAVQTDRPHHDGQPAGQLPDGATLHCVFAVSPAAIEVTTSTEVSAPVSIPTNTFGWRVLGTLTDLVEPLDTGHGGPAGGAAGPRLIGIRLVVRGDRESTDALSDLGGQAEAE